MAFKHLKSLIGLSAPPGEDPQTAKTSILAHLLMILLLEPHISAPGSPPAWPRNGPALWRLTCLAAKALLAAIMPVSCRIPISRPPSNAICSNRRENDLIKLFQSYVSAYAQTRG